MSISRLISYILGTCSASYMYFVNENNVSDLQQMITYSLEDEVIDKEKEDAERQLLKEASLNIHVGTELLTD